MVGPFAHWLLACRWHSARSDSRSLGLSIGRRCCMLTIRAMADGKGYSARHLEHSDYYAEGERVTGRWCGRGGRTARTARRRSAGRLRGATDKASILEPACSCANGKAPTEQEPTAKFSRTGAISTTSRFQRRNRFRSWRLWAATSGSSRRTNGPLPKLFRSLRITLPRVSEWMARTLIGPPAISRSPCIITTPAGNSIRSFILTPSPRT